VSLIATPCTIVHREESGSVDDWGDPVKTETMTETVCELQQRRREEPSDQGELGLSWWECFFPVGTAIDTEDAVLVEPHGEFEVVGEPWNANQGSGAVNHVATTLRKVADWEEGS
jgi:hypothetical protein